MNSAPDPARLAAVLRRALAHPLALLVIGAAFSTVLVPAYTRQAQENQQALEIRRDLAERMSATVSPFLAATLSNELVWRGKPPAAYDRAYESWSTGSDLILTRMRTRLEDHGIAEAWQDYQRAMRWLYYLFKVGISPEGSRYIILTDYLSWFLEKYVACEKPSQPCLRIDARELAAFDVPERGLRPTLDRSFRMLLEAFRLENEALVDRVIASDVRL